MKKKAWAYNHSTAQRPWMVLAANSIMASAIFCCFGLINYSFKEMLMSLCTLGSEGSCEPWTRMNVFMPGSYWWVLKRQVREGESENNNFSDLLALLIVHTKSRQFTNRNSTSSWRGRGGPSLNSHPNIGILCCQVRSNRTAGYVAG